MVQKYRSILLVQGRMDIKYGVVRRFTFDGMSAMLRNFRKTSIRLKGAYL